MKRLLATLLLLLAAGSAAACPSTLVLQGSVTIRNCPAGKDGCHSGTERLNLYLSRLKDDPTVLTIALPSSPWHLFDSDLRIAPVATFAERIRPLLKPEVRRVLLIGSWTDVAPDTAMPSLAQQLSKALGGFPVEGMDGFLWLKPDGSVRTTQQAFTVRDGGGPYGVREDENVMAAMTVGWTMGLEERIAANKDATLLMHAGVAWEMLGLCPERAIDVLQQATALGNAAAAYNASLLLRERGHDGDAALATSLLRRAADLGDKPSAEMLTSLQKPDNDKNP